MPKVSSTVKPKGKNELITSMFDPIFKSIVQHPDFREVS